MRRSEAARKIVWKVYSGRGRLAGMCVREGTVRYLIILSARYRTVCEIVGPIFLAALRLMITSNFVGCCASAGEQSAHKHEQHNEQAA